LVPRAVRTSTGKPGGIRRIGWERCSPIFAAASAEDRRRAELSPGGYGIHWPTLDEDLSIGGLVR
jgi:hypothetical protein